MRFRIIPLEERIVLDAAAIVDAAAPPTAAHADAAHIINDSSALPIAPTDPLHMMDASPEASAPVSLLVISSDVKDAHILAQASRDPSHTIVFDAKTSTLDSLLAQIKANLNGQKADTIAIATNGTTGAFQLTNGVAVSAETLEASPQLRSFWNELSTHLNDGAQVDLLACKVAEGPSGEALMRQLDNLLGVKVAASTDVTANLAQGGNWYLEAGQVDACSLFNHEALSLWTGSLDTPVINSSTVSFSPAEDSTSQIFVTVTVGGGHTIPSGGTVLTETHGTIVRTGSDTNFSFTYTSDLNYYGPDTIVITSTDSGGHVGTLNIGVTVFSVNDAPVGANSTLTITQNSTHVFTASEFPFSDPNDSQSPNNLSLIRTTGILPNVNFGTIYSNGVPVTTNTSYAPNTLSFVPALHQGGSTTFRYFVVDDGGTLNGGVDQATAFSTMTLPIVGVDAITGPSTATFNEDISKVFSTANGNAIVITEVNGQGNITVDLSSTNGILTLGTTVNLNSLVGNGTNHITFFANQLRVDTALDGLTFTPGANYNGSASIAVNGKDLLQNFNYPTHTIALTINSVEDPLVITVPSSVLVNEDVPYVFSSANGNAITYIDVDTNDIITATVASHAEHGGSFTLATTNGITILGGGPNYIDFSGLQSDINAALNGLIFTPGANYYGPDDIFLQAYYGLNPAAFQSITVTINASPVAVDDTASTNEDTPLNGSTVLSNDTDPDNNPLTLTAVLTVNAAHGNVVLNSNGTFTYTPSLNYNGSDFFKYKAQDPNGALSDEATVTIDIASINDPPTGNSSFVTIDEDTVYHFSSANFNFSDPNDSPPNTLQFVKILSLPLSTKGVLWNGSTIVNINDLVSPNNLIFVPTANAINNATFNYALVDNGSGVTSTPENTSGSKLFTIVITSVNDAPVVDISGVTNTTMLEDTINEVILNPTQNATVIDVEGQGVTTTLSALHGSVFKVGPNSGFTIHYLPDFDYYGSDTITMVSKDSLNATTTTLIPITILTVNDAPFGADSSITESMNTTIHFTANDFPFTDTKDPLDVLSLIKFQTIPNAAVGTIYSNGVAVVAGNNGYDPNSLSFVPINNFHGNPVSFSYWVRDNGGTDNGGVDTSVTARTMTLTIVGEDAIIAPDTATLDEDIQYTFSVANGNAVAITEVNSTNLIAVDLSSTHGILTLATTANLSNLVGNGTNHITFQANELRTNTALNGLKFTPSANYNGSASITVGSNNVTTPETIDLNINAIDDPLVITAPSTGTLNEDSGSYLFSSANGTAISFNDVDGNNNDTSQLITFVLTSPQGGTFIVSPGTGIPPIVREGTMILRSFQSLVNSVLDGLRYLPPANFSGTDSILVQAFYDTYEAGNSKTILMTVNPVGDAPSGTDNTITIDEDTSYTLNTSDFGFSDPIDSFSPNQPDGVKITLGAGTLTWGGFEVFTGFFIPWGSIEEGGLVYTPPPNANGDNAGNFTFQVKDTDTGFNNLDLSPNTMTFNINSINDNPEGTDATIYTNQGQIYFFNLEDFGFTDPNDNPPNNLTTVIIDLPSHGFLGIFNGIVSNDFTGVEFANVNVNIINGEDGRLYYRPDPGFNGPDSFHFQVVDDGSAVDSTPNTMTLIVDDPPVANDDSATTNEDTPINIPVLDNDTDVGPLTSTITQAPSHGSLSLNGDGSYAYTPEANYNGSDSFKYKAQDSFGVLSNEATVTIDIIPVPDSPAGQDISVTMNQGHFYIFNPEDFGFSDPIDNPPNNFSSIFLTTLPQHGTLAFYASNFEGDPFFNISNPQFVGVETLHDILSGNVWFIYRADPSYSGVDSFQFQVVDDGAIEDGQPLANSIDLTPNTFTFNIETNVAPIATEDNHTVNEDTTLINFVLDNDTDVNNDQLFATLVSGVSHGNLLFFSDGGYIYTPQANYYGTDSFTYKANDGFLESNVATVNITIVPINDVPVANNDSVSINEDTPTLINVLANDTDADGDSLSVFSITQSPLHGTAIINENGLILYTPNSNYHGSDSFKYIARDPTGALSNEVPVSINIVSVNDAPVAHDDNSAVYQNSFVNGNVLTNDTDAENNPLTASLVAGPAHGILSFNTDGTFTYTPNPNFHGLDGFTYKANDGQDDSNTANVEINVIGPPEIIFPQNSYNMAENNLLALSILIEDQSPGTSLTVTLHSDNGIISLSGSVSIPPGLTVSNDQTDTVTLNGSLSDILAVIYDAPIFFSSDLDFVGTTTLVVTANDNESNLFSSNDVTINVEDFTAHVQSYNILEDATLQINLNNAASSGFGLPINFSITQPQHGTVIDHLDGTFTYTPTLGYFGPDSFTYVASDGIGVDGGSIYIGVTPVIPQGDPVIPPGASSGLNNLDDLSFINPKPPVDLNGTLYFIADETNGVSTGLWKVSNGEASLVTVIDPLNRSAASDLISSDGKIFFVVLSESGRSLWESDGTDSGTIQLTQNFDILQNLTDVNGTLFFSTLDISNQGQLWKSDGTVGGTTSIESFDSFLNNLTNVNGTLYFTGHDSTHGYELWKSDGITTQLVEDINPGAGDSNLIELTNVNGVLYFVADDGTGSQLWRSDGINTVSITDFPSTLPPSINHLTNVNGTLYFGGNDGTDGYQVWTYDGATLAKVTSVDALDGGLQPTDFTLLNGSVYFIGVEGTGSQIWQAIGSTEGAGATRITNDFAFISDLTSFNDILVFSSNDSINGTELWQSDGTLAGTMIAKDIIPGNEGAFPNSFVQSGNHLFFTASIGNNETGLLEANSAGNSTTPMQVSVLDPLSTYQAKNLITVDGNLYFTAFNALTGTELWQSNGTLTGTYLLADIFSGPSSSFISNMTDINGTLYFTATDGINLTQLWTTDGSSAGTYMISDSDIGSVSGYLTDFNGQVYFSAANQLWKTDGTQIGTIMVTDIEGGFNPRNIVAINGALYMSGTDIAHGAELWTSDGTTAGTHLIADINLGIGNSNPVFLTNLNGNLLFNDASFNDRLWQYNTTTQTVSMITGPNLVRPINVAFGNLNGNYNDPFTIIGNDIYFGALDSISGIGIWKSDGSDAGTHLISPYIIPGQIINVGNTLFFSAATDGGTDGFQLWTSDGTLNGTVRLTDINEGFFNPSQLVNLNGTLYFTANDGIHGTELWLSDGTTAGTKLAADVLPGSIGSSITRLTAYDGTLAFNAKGSILDANSTLWVLSNFTNQAPVAVNDSYSGDEDSAQITGNVLTNDIDVDNDTLTASLVTGPTHGSLTLNSDGSFTYTPNANYSGPDSFTYRAHDVLVDSNLATVTITIDPVNDAPSGTFRTVITNEDTAYTFTATDFGFTDPNDLPANSLIAVKITTLPLAGTLKDNGVLVSAGDFVSIADINAGLLKFMPATNGNGVSYANFTFQVQDNGGTANGGVDLDQSPNTIQIDVTSINDAPSGTDNTITINEDTSYTFTTADFGYSDPNDFPANNLAAVKITTLPSAGTLKYNSNDVAEGQAISALDINAGLLKFIPASNENEVGYANFTFQVIDDGGIASGGVNLDPIPNTMTFNVNSVNDSPSGTDNTIITNEDTPYTFTAADFGFSDANDFPANILTAVKITTLPSAGTLTDNGIAITSGQSISVADINGGLLKFVPAANANGNGYAQFTFQVQDDGGTANGGVDLDQSPNSMTINVTAINDAPVAVDDSYSVNQNNQIVGNVITNDTDAELDPLSISNFTNPSHGSLILSVNGAFTYIPNSNYNGLDSFTYQVSDGHADSNVATVTINIVNSPENDAPSGSDKTITINEDTSRTFTAADFGFSDPNDSPPNTLLAVKISSLPTAGTLTNNGVAVTTGQFISLADLNAGLLVFNPVANANGNSYAQFTFQVQDNGGTANGGVDLDPSANTITINVTAVNDAPINNVPGPQTMLEDGTLILNQLSVTDVDSDPLNIQVVLSTSGGVQLHLTSSTGLTVTGDTTNILSIIGSKTNINLALASGLSFKPAANVSGIFNLQMATSDLGNSGSGGVKTDTDSISITVTPVNDAPSGTSNPLGFTIAEDSTLIFTTGMFAFSDTLDNPNPNTLLAIKLTTLPTNGTITLTGSPNPNAGDFILPSDIAAGKLKFTPAPNGNGAGYGNFTFQVQDNGGTANGGVDLDQTPNAFIINVGPVNDAPSGADNTIGLSENSSYKLTASDFGFTDPNDSPPNTLLSVTITTLPSAGSLTNNGSAVTAGQAISIADINAEHLVFTPDFNANGNNYAHFTFQVRDNGGIANGGQDTDPTPNTITFNVSSVNESPVANNDSFTTNEDIPLSGNVLTNDTDGDLDTLTAILVTGPAHGSLTLNLDGSFTYNPTTNYNGPDSFTYRANDGFANSNTATVSISIISINDAPVAVNDNYSTNEDTPLFIPGPGVLGNDIDVEGDPFAGALLMTNPSHGSVVLDADGSFTYIPDANFYGQDSFTYKAHDGLNESDNTATVTITVNPVQDAPQAFNDNYFISENSTLILNAPGILGNDIEIDGEAITAVLVSGPTHGNLVLNSNGSLTYTPDIGYVGSDTFTYVANDGIDDSNVATVTVVMEDVNFTPIVNNDQYTIDEDTTLIVDAPGVLGNDTDADNDPLTAILVTDPTNGSLTFNSDGSFSYTPNPNFHGSDSFTYKANDGFIDSAPATVTILIGPVNDTPVSIDDSYSTNEDTQLSIPAPGLLGNDTDVEDDPLSIIIFSNPSHGSLVLNSDGAFTYTPQANYFGSDSFTYRANDGFIDGNLATVTITVNPINDAPVANNDTASTTENTPVSGNVLTNDTDAENNTLSAVLVSGPAHGSLTLNPDGSFTYTPATNYNGSDSFTYKANDGSANSNTATVSISIGSVNEVPVAANDSYSGNEDTPITGNVLTNDTDGDLDTLTAILVTGPAHGSLTLNLDGSFTYTPTANYNGPDSFTYRANDGFANSDTATVSLTIIPVNDAPVAVNDSFTTNEDTPFVPNVSANDTDVDGSVNPFSVTVISGPSHGTLSSLTGIFTYTPNPNYNGTDSFTYRINDGSLNSNIATATITISPVNDAPIAVGNTYTLNEDTVLTVNAPGILGNDTDVDGPIIAVLGTGPAHGTLIFNSNGSFTYTPHANFNGADSFTYKAFDGTTNSDIVTVSLNINPVNDSPSGTDKTISIAEDDSHTFTDSDFGFSDVNDDPSNNFESVIVSTLPSAGTLTNNGIAVVAGQNISLLDILAGHLVFTPNANGNGSSYTTFTFQVVDDGAVTAPIIGGGGGGGPGPSPIPGPGGPPAPVAILNRDFTPNTITINVDPVDDAPVAVDDTHTINEDTTLSVNAAAGVLSNDTEVDGDPVTAVLVTGPAHGSLTLNADGSFSYIPEANYNGPDSFTYRSNDGISDSNLATVSITVNEAPVANDDDVITDEDTSAFIEPLANDIVVDSSIESFTQPTHGIVSLQLDGTFLYIPASNYYGPDSFTYIISDGTLSDSATVFITVNPINDAPVASEDTYHVTEDTPLSIPAPGILANDNDVDSNDLSAVLVSGPSSGTLTLLASGAFLYTPFLNFVGADSFLYIIKDGAGATSQGKVNIIVDGVNDAPIISGPNATQVVAEDTAITFIGSNSNLITISDVDANGGVERITIQDTHGKITVGSTSGLTVTGNGTNNVTLIGNIGSLNNALNGLSYTPDTNYNGSDSIVINVNDQGNTGSGGAQIVSKTINVNISAVNDAPVATNDSYNAVAGALLSITAPGVLTNDRDVDSIALAAVLVNGPAHGTLNFNVNGSFNYTATSGFSGTDTFTYRARDGSLSSNIATVSIVVAPNNNVAPTLDFKGSDNPFYIENKAPAILVPAARIIDPDTQYFNGGKLTIAITQNSSLQDILSIEQTNYLTVIGNQIYYNSKLIGTFSGGHNGASLVISFNGNADKDVVRSVVRHIGFSVNSENPSTAQRTVSFVLTDGEGGTSKAEVKTVTVKSANDAPVISSDSDFDSRTIIEGQKTNIGANLNLRVTDVDAAASNLFRVTLQVNYGSLNISSLAGILANPNNAAERAAFFMGSDPGISGKKTLQFQGTLEQVNIALQRLTYLTLFNNKSNDLLVFKVSDSGGSTLGGIKKDDEPIKLIIKKNR